MADHPPLLYPGTTVPVKPLNARHEAHLRSRGFEPVNVDPEAPVVNDTPPPGTVDVDAPHPVDLTRSPRPGATPHPTED